MRQRSVEVRQRLLRVWLPNVTKTQGGSDSEVAQGVQVVAFKFPHGCVAHIDFCQ